MTEPGRCQRCGSLLPQFSVLGGRCARCMLELGFESLAGSADDSETINVFEPPVVIGRYRVLRLIGEGGMGTVYEAEQSQPRRTVALKIIKPGMASTELLRRFEQETQALGRLQHPGIAQIYEAGTVDTGFGPQPYFAMELIHGSSPRDYAETHHLNTRERLAIMMKICEAVHHAHQRGLIHRDLKPGNILIDETGQPKILDFGVARVTDSDSRATVQTDLGQLIGTLAYMSPEQVLADPLDIDTRSDVYSLGVILYEFLSGRLPYPISKKLHETIQTIREEDPAKLGAVNRTFRGDIETIVAKALEKDRARRYASAAEMAADIQRFLKDEPIVARPPSTSYQLQKFARRHKALVSGVTAVFFVLVAGVIVSTTLLVRARRADDIAKNEANRADEEATEAKVVRDVVFQILTRARPIANQGPGLPAASPTLKASIDQVALQVNHGQFVKQPQSEAAVRELIAGMYSALGKVSESRDQLENAVTLRRHQLGDADPHTLNASINLADAYVYLGMYSTAESFAKKVIIDSRHTRSEVDIYIQSAVRILDRAYRFSTNRDRSGGPSQTDANRSRGFSSSEALLKDDVIDYQRRKYGEGNSTVQYSENVLLTLYIGYSPPKYEEAELFAKQTADERRRALGEDNPATINWEKQLIGLYLMPQPQPKYAEAKAYLKMLAIDLRRTLGEDNPRTQATICYLLGVCLKEPQPNYGEAEALLKSILEGTRSKLGSEDRATRNASIALANVYFKQDRYKEAEDVLTPYATDVAVADAMTHPLVLLEQIALSSNLHPLSVHTFGGKPISLADEMARLTLLEQPTIVDVLDRLAQTYVKQGRVFEAQAAAKKIKMILQAVLTSTRDRGDWEFGRPLESMGVMAIRYIEEDRTIEADDMLNSVMDGYKRVGGKSANGQEIATLITSAALTYTGKGNNRRAEELLNAITKVDEVGSSRNFTLSSSLGRLGSWYMDRGRYVEAREIYDRAEVRNGPHGLGNSSSRSINMDAIYDMGEFIPK